MSLRINNNIPAMTALRNLQTNSAGYQGVVERLSSGLRINTAADDPAGLIVSEGMRAQIKGIEQANRNAQDAVNMSKTAEGAMDEIQRLLRDMRALAVNSANTAVVDANTLQANQAQIRSSIESINRIAEQTQFGTKRLLDGTAGVQANITSGGNLSSVFMGGTFAGESITSGPMTVQKVSAATRAQTALTNAFASANAVVSTAGTFVINGYSFNTTGTETLQSLVNRINAASNATNVTAQIVPNGPGVSVTLTQNTYGAQFSVNCFDANNILNGSSTATSTGSDAVFSVSATTTGNPAVRTALFTGGRGPGESGLKLTDNYGNTFQLTEVGNAGLASATAVAQITEGNVRFQIGAFADQSVSFGMPNCFANRLGVNAVSNQSIETLDVTTQTGSSDAMKIIDDAITQLARMRGELGSFQKNFLESTQRSLDIAKENLTSTESSIRDADMAAEITEYTRIQILQQSGMSVLAQANQIPQQIVQLLRG